MKGTADRCSKEKRGGKDVADFGLVRRLVASQQARTETGLFYTDGLRFVTEARHSGACIESLIACDELLTLAYGRKLAREIEATGVPVLRVGEAEFRQVSSQEEPQGLGAVVRQRWERLNRARPDQGLGWVALDEVRSPGNLGTIIRTADAVGAAGLVLIGDEIDLYDPRVVRATMGSLFALRYVRVDPATFLRWKAQHGGVLIGTSPHAERDYHTFRYPRRAILWMGSERKGLSDDALGQCDALVRIPMVGRADSLNVAVATAVVLYELFNRRR